MGGISFTHLLIICVIVVLLFGTDKLRNLGSDLGSALKGFKKAINEDTDSPAVRQDLSIKNRDHLSPEEELLLNEHTGSPKQENVKNDEKQV